MCLNYESASRPSPATIVAVDNPVRIMVITLAEELSTKEHPINTQLIDEVIHKNYGRVFAAYRAGVAESTILRLPGDLQHYIATRMRVLKGPGVSPEEAACHLAWLCGAGSFGRES